MSARTMRAKHYRAELWQGGMMVACVEGPDEAFVARNINHYALMYGPDGPIEIRYKPLAARKKERK